VTGRRYLQDGVKKTEKLAADLGRNSEYQIAAQAVARSGND